MPLASLEELQSVAHRGAPEYHDAYSELALAQRFEEYRPRRRDVLASFSVTIDGRSFPTFYAAALEPGLAGQEIVITLADAPVPCPAWEYLHPFRALSFAQDGGVEIGGLGVVEGGGSRRAIGRVLLREHYVPQTEETDRLSPSGGKPPAPFTELLPLQGFLKAVRDTGVVPFSVALLLYMSDERMRLETDFVDNWFLKDLRSGRLPSTRRVVRSPRVSRALDGYIASGQLQGVTARAFEVLVESSGLSPVDLAHVLGSVRELAQSALDALVARRLATFDRRTGIYRARLESIGSAVGRAGASVPAPSGPLPNPLLKTSVSELIAAADSRATCPLCGDPLPAQRGAILCARCAAEVAAENGASSSRP